MGGRQPDKAKRELTKVMNVVGNELVATWPDGDKWTVEGMTVEEWQKEAKQTANELWVAKHSVTKCDLRVVRRKDRTLLVSLQEKGHDDAKEWSQVCQVKVDCFKSEQQAVDFLVGIGIDYELDNVQKSALYKERDERMKNGLKDPHGRCIGLKEKP